MPASSEYIYDDGTTDAERYLQGCLDGKYVVGETIKKLARRMLKEIKDGFQNFRYDPTYATRPVEWIEHFCYLSSGTLGVPFILEPYERCIIELIFGFVDEYGYRRFHEALVVIGRKNGKCLSVDTEIPTPDGWRRMADIHEGDYVFGCDGEPSKVLVESEVFDKPMYLVTFEDGAEIKASGDHVWTVCDEHGLSRRDLHTSEMYDMFGYGGTYHVPTCHAVKYPFGHQGKTGEPSVGDSYNSGFVASFGFFSPEEYLRDIRFASVTHRCAFVHGVVDGALHNGLKSPVFDSREDAEGIAEVASSIGLVAGVRESPRVGSWTVVIEEKPAKSIVSIERIPNEPSKCIAIDNDSHLYLAGRQYTATHNTELCAALNLYMLTSDGEGAPQCYNCATNESQASLCFGATWRMVQQSKNLSKYVKKGVVTERKTVGLKYAPNLGYLVTVTRNADALDGLNCHYAVLDELAAMRDRSTYDLLKGSLGSQKQPLIFCITTNGKVRENIFDRQREYALKWLDGTIEDPRFIGILYEMDSREEVEDEAMWPKANPGLGTVKKWDYMRGEMTKARNDPSYRPEVMTKQFNLPSNQASAFLSWEAATCRTGWEFDPREFKYGILGIDAADAVDLSAACCLMMKPGDDHIYRKSMYWIPEEKLREGERANVQSGDPWPYREWEAQGLLRVVPQSNVVPKTVFLDWIQELASMGIYIRAIGYDQWHMQEIEERMKMLVGEQNVIRVPQWPKNLSDPMKRMRADLEAGRIIWNSAVDDVNNLNVSVSIDHNDNYMPIKKNRVLSNRIDGFMAMLDAYVVLMQRWDDYHAAVTG